MKYCIENMNVFVSIVVPVYKCEKWLERCVDSILRQTFSQFELILVEDGSPDLSGAICDRYALQDGRVIVLHQENRGVSAARLSGLQQACGEWICFIDSDDYVEPDYLERLIHTAKEKQVQLVCCNCVDEGITWQENNCIEEQETVYDSNRLLDLFFEGKRFAYVVWGKLFHRSLLQQAQFVKLQYTEDTYLFLSCIPVIRQAELLPYQGYHYVAQEESAMAVSRLDDVYRDNLTTFCYLCEVCSSRGEIWINKAKEKLLWTVFVAMSIHFKTMPRSTDADFLRRVRDCRRWLDDSFLWNHKKGKLVLGFLISPHLIGMMLRGLYRIRQISQQGSRA